MTVYAALKLRAEDDEDLAIISACLRCALTSLGEMAYDREARRFAAILVRPLWETAPPKGDTDKVDEAPDVAALKRMRAGLHFDHVSAVRFRRLDRSEPNKLLHLVAIVSASLSERFAIILSFEGGGEVFLEVDKIRGQMRDLDAPPENIQKPDPPQNGSFEDAKF
ncbi:MAG: DUF2948 family protein [Rhodospirillaceae bacterium]|jgi:hypothetical protein|nr:DUF2948 family protein [Rhodospirillaceae bacterium]MBT3926984.1 DUF2948 family protein [Rhodospirillaceae bacterium]MBT4427556.1 DUF2948 family protein [Rhodospirillaceae bacterium]MBT5037898.1 DUF2948 family protein [Rhodospirillaceae bacterium]MBT5675439.1 DUF2948 family protein [Rhodospirillaceae bacterium]